MYTTYTSLLSPWPPRETARRRATVKQKGNHMAVSYLFLVDLGSSELCKVVSLPSGHLICIYIGARESVSVQICSIDGGQ
jgi:hypothetical protein